MPSLSAKEIYSLKQQAAAYYSQNGVPQKMEEILNSMFYERPDDVYGHLANFFELHSETPSVTKVSAREGIDSRGQPAVMTSIYCKQKNVEKLICSSVIPNASSIPDHARPDEKDEEQREIASEVEMSIKFINELINTTILGRDPTKQHEIDDLIMNSLESEARTQKESDNNENGEDTIKGGTDNSRPASTKNKPKSAKQINLNNNRKAAATKDDKMGKKGAAQITIVIPDEPKEEFLQGCSAIAAVSKAFCEVGAKLQGIPLYQHISQLKNEEKSSGFLIPQPMVSLISGAKASQGKVNCIREYMIVPRHDMPLRTSIPAIMKIFYRLGWKQTSGKATVIGKSAKGVKGAGQQAEDAELEKSQYRMVNDLGIYCPPLEKPEQGLDMIQEAITAVGMEPGTDFFIALNCAAQECFDYEKGRYEVVMGTMKEPDQMPDFWCDLVTRYPSIIALIDPIRKEEIGAWQTLCDKVSESVYVGGDTAYARPGLLKNIELTDDFKTSAYVIRQEKMNSVSDIIATAKKMQDAKNTLIVKANTADTSDAFLSDLAVGLGARYLMVGGACRGERISKLNRLMEIEVELEDQEKMDAWDKPTFTHLTPPVPPSTGEDGSGEENQVEKDASKK